jgi:hypothetical protein
MKTYNLNNFKDAVPANQSYICNEIDWINSEQNNYAWYYQAYPQLKQFNLPLSMEFLKYFYSEDMQTRNLNPEDVYLNCYAFLWSYFIGRITGQINFKGKTFWERLPDLFPKAINKTFNQVTNPFGISLPIWLLIGVVIILAVKK